MSGKDAATLLAERVLDGRGLHKAHIQIADRCNHACVHCYQVQGEKGELSPDEVLVLLDRLKAAGVFLLTISGGEATLRRDLVDVVAHARGLGMGVTLYTNGYNVTAELAAELARLAVWRVHISVYGATAETHDAVTRVPGSFDRTLSGVRTLRRAGVAVFMKTPVMRGNYREVRAVAALAASLGCVHVMDPQVTCREDGSAEPVGLNLDQDAYAEYLSSEHAKPEYTPEAIAGSKGGRTCSIGRGVLLVEPNGEVRPCTALNVGVGNALHDDLAAITNGEVMQFLKGVSVATIHGCRECDLLPGCTRCHGNAMYEVGDAFAPYPSACELALARYRVASGGKLDVLPLEQAGDEPARPKRLGPFRIESKGVVRQIEDVRTEEDEAIARRFHWVRPAAGYASSMIAAPMGEPLVQLGVRRSASAANHPR